ncbi:MAG: site-specific DNA-methyltransferase [Prevotellaceae bacterium]|jgi:DNA modification methylase|nr:site-specific DNA-methyltransferase [Prevotellaceae bacterium]
MMEINSVYKTDCLLGFKNIDNESVDLIFTDPPYCQNRAQNITNLKNHKDVVTEFKFDGYSSEKEYLRFIEKVLRECYRVSKDGASGYLWCGDDFVSYINRIVEKAGFQFRKVIHWHKTNPFPAIHTRKIFANSMELIVHFSKGTPKTWNHKHVNEMHNFIETPICMGKERKKHQTQKPLKVCIPFIEISSNENDLILDPFMGSGTTAIAALMTNRNFIGFEIDNGYCEIIAERFEEFVLKHANFKGIKPQIKL